MAVIRTYESYAIAWDGGGSWSGYDSEEAAAAQLASATRTGEVVRRTWELTIEERYLHLYQPGIAERPAEE